MKEHLYLGAVSSVLLEYGIKMALKIKSAQRLPLFIFSQLYLNTLHPIFQNKETTFKDT